MDYHQNLQAQPNIPNVEPSTDSQASSLPTSNAQNGQAHEPSFTSTDQGGGVYELLQALRQAMNEDTQTTAFKQFSQVQQHMIQAQQVQQVASQPPPAQLAMRPRSPNDPDTAL
ncbi:hypothetical protein NCC49_000407 [Naganishia albida]|nr:hypothetical protein NCC49_000407 [Naganishia albida]